MINATLSIFKSRHLGFLRSEIGRLLMASTCFSCVLLLLRIIHTGKPMFLWLVWNLFLAYVPYLLSSWLTLRQPTRWRLLILSAIWLLFIPNSFYILTDLFHLIDCRSPRVPAWFDLSLIFSFAWNGLLLGVLSVRQMEKLVQGVTGAWWGRFFVYPVMALNALGVYAGRYLRLNSWDILTNPFQLTLDMSRLIIHPFQSLQAWGMIACYTILLSFIYQMLKKLSHALT
ncbi:MAG TPA: DUF1361 domain-containing protein [Puia sp.]|nr:DUF1361 domain-containing protein [Puia sp.]